MEGITWIFDEPSLSLLSTFWPQSFRGEKKGPLGKRNYSMGLCDTGGQGRQGSRRKINLSREDFLWEVHL